MINRKYRTIGRFSGALALASAAFILDGCNTIDDSVPQEHDGPLSDKAPNIIFILADDLGYGDISMTDGFNTVNSRIATPNIDRIAAQGFNFSNAYVASPVCAPSRGGFFTSRFPSVMGFEGNQSSRDNFANIGDNTMASLLKEAGYSTALIGKWDMGGNAQGQGIIANHANSGLFPHARGFDYFCGFMGGTNSFYPTGNVGAGTDGWHLNGDAAVKGGQLYGDVSRNIREYGLAGSPTDRYPQLTPQQHLTDFFTDKALTYIDSHANQVKPFFLFLSHHAPHDPFQVPDKFYQKYPDITDARTRIYAAMVHHMDERIGEVLDKLDELGITGNTVVVFASDNGGVSNRRSDGGLGHAFNGGMRDGKWSVFEGGIRVPFAFSWPDVFKGGQLFHQPITLLDLLPTLLRAAGVSGTSIKTKGFDGVDILPWLSGWQSGPIHDVLFWRYISDIPRGNNAVMYAVRKGEMKYVFTRVPGQPGQEYLFNLVSNRAESDAQNLIHNPAHTAELAAIKSALDKWEAAMKPLPTGTPSRE